MDRKSSKEYYTRANGSIGIRTINNEPSLTIQDYVHDVDVNNIMDRFLKTGQLIHVAQSPQIYTGEDFTPVTDLQTSIHFVKNVEEKFNNLNKKLKNRFGTPKEFYEFLIDPKNKDELKKLKLINDDDQTTTTATQVSSPPPQTPPPQTPPPTSIVTGKHE